MADEEDVTPAVTGDEEEPERRRISDYLGDLSRVEALLEEERRQNQELRTEVEYQRRRIDREEEARLHLMQLLDNSQRLLGNSQQHVQLALGGSASKIYSIAAAAAPGGAADKQAATDAPSLPRRRRWWGR